MESRWPEHTPEPDEPPPWRGWAIGAAAIVAVALLVPRDVNWRMPSFTMPEFSLPELDLRGRTANDQPPPPVTAEISETPDPAIISEALGIEGSAPFEDGRPMVQHVPFEACLSTIEQSAGALGPPALIENTPDRRVARFKFVEGALSVTCSRPDGTMTIEQTN